MLHSAVERIGVREPRQNASVYLRRVQAGDRFVVTDRGVSIAELGPLEESPFGRLVREGRILPPTASFDLDAWQQLDPNSDGPGASEVLRQLRDEGRG